MVEMALRPYLEKNPFERLRTNGGEVEWLSLFLFPFALSPVEGIFSLALIRRIAGRTKEKQSASTALQLSD